MSVAHVPHAMHHETWPVTDARSVAIATWIVDPRGADLDRRPLARPTSAQSEAGQA